MPSSTRQPQLLSVDVELYRRQERFTGTSLADCLDYDRLYYHITKQWPAREHVELLERLADDLAEYCLVDARVEACRVIIRKLEVYPGQRHAGDHRLPHPPRGARICAA